MNKQNLSVVPYTHKQCNVLFRRIPLVSKVKSCELEGFIVVYFSVLLRSTLVVLEEVPQRSSKQLRASVEALKFWIPLCTIRAFIVWHNTNRRRRVRSAMHESFRHSIVNHEFKQVRARFDYGYILVINKCIFVVYWSLGTTSDAYTQVETAIFWFCGAFVNF